MPYRIADVLRYINTLLMDPENDDRPLVHHLNNVKFILLQSKMEDGTINVADIHKVIQYIETIKIEKKKGFFGSAGLETMGELLAQHGETILPASKRPPSTMAFSSGPLLSVKHHKIFGLIHHTLYQNFLEYLQYPKNQETQRSMTSAETIWAFSYPKDEGGEIMNQAIGEWQARLMQLPEESPRLAYIDYMRDLSIQGMVGRTEADVDRLLEYLVADSEYTAEQKAAIIRWMQSNGGQSNNRFVDVLIGSGAYTNGVAATNLKSKRAEQNWTMENGKVVMHCDITSYALMIGGVPYINSSTNKLETIDDVETLSDPRNRFSPMLRMQATIKLEVNADGHVEPRIDTLNVTSYNKMLSPPEKPVVEQTDTPRPK